MLPARILTFLLLTIFSFGIRGQEQKERILYVVDDIPVIKDPAEDEGTMVETDIETVTVITNKADIAKQGFNDVDKIIFIITKEYVKRPDEIRKIPTTKQMEKKNGKWHFKGNQTPYSGPFINYYFNGKKKEEGTFKDGHLDALLTAYGKNGTMTFYKTFINGLANGESKEYFQNGKIRQAGAYKNGRDDGIWKEWYSTGLFKRQVEYKDGQVIPAKEEVKFYFLLSRGRDLFDQENYSGAVKNYNKAIELNPNYSDVYLHRSRAFLYDFKFDEALVDCDKAIAIEPLYMEAYSNRAFVTLRKYEIKNSRVVSKTHGVTVLASKDKVEIPKDELEKMCADLKKGYELGDTKSMITDAMKRYCP